MKRIIFFCLILIEFGLAQTGAKYLVITHDNFYNAIQPLAQWKQKKGLQSKVVKLSDFNAAPESLTKIKNYIINAYNTWNPRPEYVLLVGSAGFIRTDNNMYDDFYANMNGNYLQEIAIGRLPCSTATQCSVMVAKTLGYEQIPYMSDTLWYKKGTGIIREDVASSDSVYWNNMHFIWNLWRNAGYIKIDSFSRLNGDSAQLVESAITDGRAFVVFRGQGVTNWWAPFAVVPTRMNNGFKLPIVISGTCVTINLGSTGGSYLGENFLKAGSVSNPQGAVAFFGTTNSTSGPGIAELRGVVTVNFFKTVFSENNYKLGDVVKRAKYLIDSIRPPYYTSTFYREWNLLGDPELNVWTSVPKQLTVVYDTVIPTGQQNYSVTVRQGTNPIQNALVCIMRDTLIYQSNYTNSSGQASFSINPQTIGTMTITVTARNFRPFEGNVRIRSSGMEEDGIRDWELGDRKVIRIYPNPCRNIAEIYYNQLLWSDNSLKIFDVQGRLVDSKIERVEDSKINVNLGKLPNGIYMVYFKNEVLGKIVKQ